MKNILLKSRVFLVCCCIAILPASLIAKEHHQESATYFNHLGEVNKEWYNHQSAYPQGTIQFESDADRIQLHLKLVCKSLAENSPSGLTTEQLKNRFQLIYELSLYADAKIFPQNKYHVTRQPYFVDEREVHCAVGYLMAVSGHEELVAKIRSEHNYDYIEDIKTPGVAKWALEYGFTIDELKWIQPTYGPSTDIDSINGGANNRVKEVAYDLWEQRIIFAGEFDSLDHLPCLQIGYYKDGQLSCLGSGVNGVIKDVLIKGNNIYVFGGLVYGGDVYPGAFYDGTIWNYITIPGREGATCTAASSGPTGYKYQIAINHASIPGKQEIWALSGDNVWYKQIQVNGIVLDMESIMYDYRNVIAGHFDSLTTYHPGGIIDTTIMVYNVAMKEYGIPWYGIADEVSDTVKVVKKIGDALFFGGSCSSAPGLSNVCLTRYYNGTLQPLFLRDNDFGPVDFSVNAITYDEGYNLIFGGFFYLDEGIPYGQHLAAYNLVSNNIEPMSVFNGAVNGLDFKGNTLYIGGDFTNNGWSLQTLNYMAQSVSYNAVDETSTAPNLTVYPNPFIDKIYVGGVADGARYSIVNASGQVIGEGVMEGNVIADLEALSPGLYFLTVETDEGVSVHRLMK